MKPSASVVARASSLWPLLGLLLLALLGCNRGLWTPDEPREAEISREMWLAPSVIPTLNGERFIEKPPLYYWAVAATFRLSGGPSVTAARAVSVVASLATLALLFAWAAAAHSRSAGIVVVLMLATSVQFVVSSHWVLIDPLLMFTTTAAAWAAWELLARHDRWWMCALFYGALMLALWIKGPIGPMLVGVGLAAYVLVDRPANWRRLRPITGIGILALATALLAWAIYEQGGRAALWEWAYVNHVQRLLNPGVTGHRQPLLYYVWTLPYAVLPWLLPLIEALRPAHWRRATVPGLTALPDPARYGALLSAAMLLLLSASATKRETYLLPLLPLLFLWLGIRSYEWWQHWQLANHRGLGVAWWVQVALLCVFCLAAPIGGWVWLRRPNGWIIATLLIALLPVVGLLFESGRGRRASAGLWALGAAVTAAAVVLMLAAPLLDGMKNMAPFMRELDSRMPAGAAVYATGVDETLRAEVPFYTARAVLPLSGTPSWVLVQDNHDGHAATLPSDYRLVLSRAFGPRRTLQLWRQGSFTP